MKLLQLKLSEQEHDGIRILQTCDSHGGVASDPSNGHGHISNHKPPVYPRLATATMEWNRVLSADSAPLATVLIATLMLMTVMAMDIAVYLNHKLPPYLRLATDLDGTDLECDSRLCVATEATVDLAIAMPMCQNHIPVQYSSTLMAVTM